MRSESNPDIRKLGIGSSDMPAIMGLNKWRSPRDVWFEKMGMGASFKGNRRTKRGQKLEPICAEEYLEDSPQITQLDYPVGRIQRHDVAAWFQGHPDGRAYGLIEGTLLAWAVEFKTAEKAPYMRNVNRGLDFAYMVQLIHEMYLMDLPRGELFMLHPDSFDRHIFRMERGADTDRVFGEMFEAGERFWGHVLDGTPPDEDPPEIDIPAVAGKLVLVEGDAWSDAGAMLARAEEMKDEAEQVLKLAKANVEQIMKNNGWNMAEGPVRAEDGLRQLRFLYREVKGRKSYKAKEMIGFLDRLFHEVSGAESDERVVEIVRQAARGYSPALFTTRGATSTRGNAYWVKPVQQIEGK